MKENKLIAEFMGLEYGDYITPHYHCNWNELMPVVEKMNTTELWEEYDISHLATCLVSVDINPTYDAVVEFIKQLNKES
jgi:hypothetical protein